MSTILDEINSQVLTGYAREAVELSQPTEVLAAWFPNTETQDLEFELKRSGTVTVDVGTFRAFDANVLPSRRRAAVASTKRALPAVSARTEIGEYLSLRARAMDSDLTDTFTNDAVRMGLAVSRRLNLARGEAAQTGAVTIADEEGFSATVDFDRDPSHTANRTGANWNAADRSTPTPISDLQTAVQVYRTTNGYDPGYLMMSSANRTEMLTTHQVIDLIHGTDSAPTRSLAQPTGLDALLVAESLPPILINDELYVTDSGSERVMADDIVTMLPPLGGSRFGETLYGRTLEAERLGLELTQQPGIAVVAYDFGPPMRVETWANAIAFPNMGTPNATFALTVNV